MSNDNERHVCMLLKQPSCYDIRPTASVCSRLLNHIRRLCLPCYWHHGSALFIRSQKSLRLERERQLGLGTLIWHPYSPVKFYWDLLDVVLTFSVFIYMPLKVFMDCPQPTNAFILFCDFMACVSVLLRFRTGFISEKQVVLEPKKIAVYYLKRTFVLDLIGALPLQLCPIKGETCDIPVHTVMFLFKLLRIIHLNRNLDLLYKQLNFPFSKQVLVTVLIKTILFFHWNIYLNFQVPMVYLHLVKATTLDLKEHRWLSTFENMVSEQRSVIEKYSISAYIFCGLCFGNGFYGSLKARYIPNTIFMLRSFQGLVGLLFLTYIFVKVLRIAIYGHYPSYIYNGKLRELEKYMVLKRLPEQLKEKILNFVNYKFSQNYYNEKMILHTLNEDSKHQINMYSCKPLVSRVPLFDDMPVALINCIIFSLIPVTFMPGECVISSGQVGKSMYIIHSGTVAVFNDLGQEVKHLIDGAHFGVMPLLNPGIVHQFTIVTLEITEMFKLSSKDFQACLLSYPHLRRRLDVYHRRSTTTSY